MELIYQVKDRPPFFRNLLLGLQQVLAIIAGVGGLVINKDDETK